MNRIKPISSKDETKNGANTLFEGGQIRDTLGFCFSTSGGQTKNIKPIENNSDVVEKLIKFLKTE
jgi:hypothetical protein